MGVDDVWPCFPDDLLQARSSQAHLGQETGARRARSALEQPAIDLFLQRRPDALFGRGEMKGLPAERALLAQDGQRAKAVATVQRQ